MAGVVTQFSTEDPAKLAQKYFGLTLPVTADQLKTAFRSQCKKLHTDLSGDESTKDLFIEMKAAYDHLTSSISFLQGNEKRTVGGVPLSQLGLGIDPKKNAKDCPVCQKKGYTVVKDSASQLCPDCTFGLTYFTKCRDCNGTGQFELKSKRKVVCRACNGKGTKERRYPVVCSTCHGRMYISRPTGGELYYMCNNCSGKGELEVMNPVLPKFVFNDLK